MPIVPFALTTSARRTAVRQLALLGLLLAAVAGAVAGAARPRFYDDDPIAREPEPRDASGAQPWRVGLLYDLSYNIFVVERHRPSGTRAQNVNTIDEVPDSSWFTNRIGTVPLTPEQIVNGPLTGTPPAAGRWTITREKGSGVTPGFTAKDAAGETWFISIERRDRPEGDAAAVVIANKIFWALGYNQIESNIVRLDPAQIDIDPSATKRRPNGARTPFTRDDLDEVLEGAARQADGTYRASAGRVVPGKILGPFRYAGTRPDDPNDTVPHEHRRELRALRVFGAWTNLTDLKAGNTLDSLVTENGRGIIKHYLQDVGSTFGTANGEHEWDIGWEYFWQHGPSRRRFWSLGFALSPWQTVPYVEYPSVGRFEGDRFDPATWKPQTPTLAYMEMRADDAFWAARRVKAFTDEQIRAIVHAGQFSDAAAEQYLGDVIIKRRDRIAASYLTAVNPIVSPQLATSGRLTFENAAVSAGVAAPMVSYSAAWYRFDNATGSTTPLGETRSSTTSLEPPAALPAAPGSFVQIDVVAESAPHSAWRQPARMWFRRHAAGWTLVGLERLPDRVDAGGPGENKGTR